MAQPPLSIDLARQAVDTVNEGLRLGYRPMGVYGQGPAAVAWAAKKLQLPEGTLHGRLRGARNLHGLEPDWKLWQAPGGLEHKEPADPTQPVQPADNFSDAVLSAVRKGAATVDEIARRCQCTPGQALDAVLALRARGIAIQQFGDRYAIAAPAMAADSGGPQFEYRSRADNTYLFGVTSDNHLGSKYERLDVLNDLYDRFQRRGVDRVFNCGNWVDGEAHFNRHDLHTHGMDAQLRYLAENYPRRPGITTYAVAGDDHEGWWAQREGVDPGKYAEKMMRDAGRDDWVDLGYMEAHVKLVNANSGKEAILAVVHPGGGSAYALSYAIQKIIESLDGGEKPAVGLYGHYHKLWSGNIRNVWIVQTGCTQSQTPFLRKKRIEVHVGGAIVELEQDPATGSIPAMTPQLIRYFNRGHYNDRWSKSGDVTLPDVRVDA